MHKQDLRIIKEAEMDFCHTGGFFWYNGGMLSMWFGKKHDSRAIGNIFFDKALDVHYLLNITSLVRCVYIAHGMTLGRTGKPLVKHAVEVWEHGPVIPEVYYAFTSWTVDPKVYGKAAPYYPDVGPGPFYTADLTKEQSEIVDLVYETYSDWTPSQISEWTRRKGSPWDQVKDKGDFAKIPNNIIREYFQQLEERHELPRSQLQGGAHANHSVREVGF